MYASVPRSVSRPSSASRRASEAIRSGCGVRVQTPSRPSAGSAQSQAASTSTAACTTSPGTSPSGSSSRRRSRAPQPRSVSRPIARPGAGPSPMRPLSVDAELGQPGRPLLTRGDLHAGTHQPLPGSLGRRSIDLPADHAAPVQLSQRPHRSPSASSGSSSCPRRNVIRQPSVLW